MFLDGGRVTRSIPSGGLEQFDWARHKENHPGDSGTWAMDGEQLGIAWGDGGLHQGPLTVRAAGIEFYGKRYSQPSTAEPSDLVGRWESARGSAIAGGDGVNRLATLVVEPDGRYSWADTVGGVVGGRAAAESRTTSGSLLISGQTITFTSDDGSIDTATFLPVPGELLTAFSIDTDMFTRTDSP
jgi:hypothetical protein